LLVLASSRVNNKKSTSTRRFALALGNLDPKETPEVVAFGGAFLQQAVNAPEDRKRRAAMPLTPRPCCGLGYIILAGASQQSAWST
jgi:hypothetical protein